MPRIARLKMKGEVAVYHVMSRTALDGFVLGDVEKEYLLNLIKRLSKVYFTEVIGFCLMGNHFHLLVRMFNGDDFDDEEIKKRYKIYHGEETRREVNDEEAIRLLREKWEDLSEYMKEIKQRFSRFYNKRHGRRGFFWSDRFKSIIVDEGETLINCLAYIDLNPVRAGIVKKPEAYRWSSLGYHVQAKNADNFLSLDFGLKEFGPSEIRSTDPSGIFHGTGYKNKKERLAHYRRFVYEKGGITLKGEEKVRGVELSNAERFRYRTRYFTDSGVIGTKDFVERVYIQFKDHFTSKHEKKPKTIKGLEGIFSLKRLSEAI
ncbi:transposase [Thermodesulfobacteriota bacterium]